MKNEVLLKNGLKITKARKLIISILEKEEDPISAEDLYEIFKKKENSNLSTIYRNLKILKSKEIVEVVCEIDGISYYRLKGKKHKHSIICESCGKIIPIDHCPVEKIETDLEDKTGFKIDSHNLEFRGICPDCQKKNENK
ncbi:Fur family transcriptional regulator [Finegoldia magna]|uniref:Transcriptional repressor n=3 Tax=Finegoldia magna TaxID=1260 RepID=A0A233W8H5_FINMA|nr:Fur family transcriptional regulator [Finegoldia magna]EFL54661.1 transcriptional regulator, Fur family [Finegoldia magna BVS033A4]EGS34199.1 ferric uptake regulator family protein [Finegoldia magna SY403409CC001050417]MBS6928227.1 transcriptional repressor [Finegoldia magna]MDU1212783.1 Fur family transcriptional regulator [Finegoldia magna]MDU5186638.1 Fur family transcriptional regulator [Finegoldia magna]